MIKFEYKGTVYTLEFTKRTVRMMEKSQGFNIDLIDVKPVTYVPMLWRGAFEVHHPRIKDELVNEIYTNMGNKEELIPQLVKLYLEPINSLFDEPEEEEKKVTWEQV